ncbi:MAG: hypothetical protein ACPGO5_00655 [Patescibacteria group bacterium]
MTKDKTIVESFSGVRGVFGEGITTELARAYARAFVDILLERNDSVIFVVASDTRDSSKELRSIWVEEAQKAGALVYDIGATTTPVAFHYVREVKAHGGVMITASHNPPEYNGWKCISALGTMLEPDDMDELIDKAHSNSNPKGSGKGEVKEHKAVAVDAYIQYLKSHFSEQEVEMIKSFSGNVVLDPNGSAVWSVLQKVCDNFGIAHHGIRTREGIFERLIEPNNESLQDVAEIVSEQGALFGCGFDCDADRVELVLPHDCERAKSYGPVVSGQYVLALGVDAVLSSAQGKVPKSPPVVVNYATSSLVRDIAKKYKTETIEVDVGEIVVIMAMRKYGSLVGGEGSSSGMIAKDGVCRDGVLVFLLTILLLSSRGKTLVEQLDSYPQYYDLRSKETVDPDKMLAIREGLLSYYGKLGYTIVTNEDDPSSGIKINIDNQAWVFYRASRTEPGQYRIIVNGPDKQQLDILLAQAQELFKSLT